MSSLMTSPTHVQRPAVGPRRGYPVSPFCTKLLNLITDYIPAEKARAMLERQLVSTGCSTATLAPQDLKRILPTVLGAMTFYIPEPEKKAEAFQRITALAA